MGNDSGKVIAIVAVVAVVVGAVAFFALSNNNDEAEVSSSQNTSSQETQPEMQPTEPTENIVELAQATPDLSTLVDAVVAAGLVETLSGDGPFTVFAPTNEAFAALPDGTLDDLLKPENKAQLTDVLTYHVVASEAMAGDLSDGQTLETVQGGTLKVAISDSGEVTINGAKVVQADVDASNGVVHVIDAVLLPQ